MSSDVVDGRDDLSVIDTAKFSLVAEKQPFHKSNLDNLEESESDLTT